MRTQQEGIRQQAEKRSQRRNHPCCCFDLRFLVSEAVINKFLLLKLSCLCPFVTAALVNSYTIPWFRLSHCQSCLWLVHLFEPGYKSEPSLGQMSRRVHQLLREAQPHDQGFGLACTSAWDGPGLSWPVTHLHTFIWAISTPVSVLELDRSGNVGTVLNI